MKSYELHESNPNSLPSAHQIGDKVKVLGKFFGKVLKVSFTKAKVFYDVEVKLTEDYTTRLRHLDSVVVVHPNSQVDFS